MTSWSIFPHTRAGVVSGNDRRREDIIGRRVQDGALEIDVAVEKDIGMQDDQVKLRRYSDCRRM
jgi:hypothetical protein